MPFHIKLLESARASECPETAHEIEQRLLASTHGRPTGAAIQLMQDTATSFDMATTSESHGFMLANEPMAYQAQMVAKMNRFRGHDPADDAEAIAYFRAGSATIRRFLNDDAVARQFARLIARHALGCGRASAR